VTGCGVCKSLFLSSYGSNWKTGNRYKSERYARARWFQVNALVFIGKVELRAPDASFCKQKKQKQKCITTSSKE
jgi:hypothetical protein